MRFFFIVAVLLALPASFYVARFLVAYAAGTGSGHLQSLVLSAILFGLAGIAAMGGILADLIATNRLLLEDLRTRALRAEIEALAMREGLEAPAPVNELQSRRQAAAR